VLAGLASGAPCRPATAWAGSAIKAGGLAFDVGRPVVLWDDPEGFNAYSRSCIEPEASRNSPCCKREFNRYGTRPGLKQRTLPALQAAITQVVLHLDGCVNSRSCFHSMHDMPRGGGGCGLSAHFMIDADGTIYQTLDPLESAWHAEQANGQSIGIEICNRGDAGRNELDRLPREYRTRPVKDVVINGRTHHAFDFRPEQYRSVLALVRVLVRLFPKVKPVFPERDGKPLLETLPDPSAFAGIVGHLHVDRQKHKWDPGAFDWSALRRTLHGFSFPVALRGYDELPEDPDELKRAALAYVKNAEGRVSAFFPVGAGGLWHSGIHLRTLREAPVRAPVRGRIVAARLGAVPQTNSSRGLVLIRHDLTVGAAPFTFFSLLAHLDPQEVSARSHVPWIREAAADPTTARALLAGAVVKLGLPVEAGDLVGAVGLVQRGPEAGPEVHFEIFSAERPPEPMASNFRIVAAAADGPLVARAALLRPMDTNGDGALAVEELRTFFREGDPAPRQSLRQVAIVHGHEWGSRLLRREGWPARARSAPDMPRIWSELVEPYVFWDETLSDHAGLPRAQRVYSYHPITFLAELAVAERGGRLRWPASAPLAEGELVFRPPSRIDLDIGKDIEADVESIFGPLVGGEARIKKRAEIELISLPTDH
jgi:N-acetyl-anhydromuramyl-L-alanine amidase AmpD